MLSWLGHFFFFEAARAFFFFRLATYWPKRSDLFPCQ
jgi:hypothetical protein